MQRTWHRLKFIVKFLTCMENKPWVVQWYGDGWDYLMKDAKMCMMIPRSGRPSVVNEELVRAVEGKIRENRWFTITPLSLHFPQISRSILHKIVSDVKEAVTTCFASQGASFYDEGIQKLVQLYGKCLNNGGNYVEKQCTVCTSNGSIHGL